MQDYRKVWKQVIYYSNWFLACYDFKSAEVAKRLGLNPGSAPDLAKRKGIPLISMYSLSNARGRSLIWPNSRGTPPPPPVFLGLGGGGGGGAPLVHFAPGRPTPSLRQLLALVRGNHSHWTQPSIIAVSHRPLATLFCARIAADGNCFFQSVSLAVTGSQEFHEELHLLITAYTFICRFVDHVT